MRLAALVLMAATAAGAQELAAVGRLSWEPHPDPGEAVCSGALVAPDLVLTARHCARGNSDNPSIIHFSAGYRDGGFAELSRGAEVISAAGEGLSADVALVRLDRPLPIVPLPTGRELDPWLTRAGFRRSAPSEMEIEPLCLRLSEAGGQLHLECRAVSGNSGAPVLSRDENGRWRIVAVMVATVGAQGSIAVRIPPDIAARIAAAGIAAAGEPAAGAP